MEIVITVDGGGRILRTTRCCCAVTCADGYRSLCFGWRGPRFWMAPNTICHLGTERTAMKSFIPILPVSKGRIRLSYALSAVGKHPLPTSRQPTRVCCRSDCSQYFIYSAGWGLNIIFCIRGDEISQGGDRKIMTWMCV